MNNNHINILVILFFLCLYLPQFSFGHEVCSLPRSKDRKPDSPAGRNGRCDYNKDCCVGFKCDTGECVPDLKPTKAHGPADFASTSLALASQVNEISNDFYRVLFDASSAIIESNKQLNLLNYAGEDQQDDQQVMEVSSRLEESLNDDSELFEPLGRRADGVDQSRVPKYSGEVDPDLEVDNKNKPNHSDDKFLPISPNKSVFTSDLAAGDQIVTEYLNTDDSKEHVHGEEKTDANAETVDDKVARLKKSLREHSESISKNAELIADEVDQLADALAKKIKIAAANLKEAANELSKRTKINNELTENKQLKGDKKAETNEKTPMSRYFVVVLLVSLVIFGIIAYLNGRRSEYNRI